MVGAMRVFMHWMQAQWPHGITAVSHGLVQTGQFVDDAAAAVDWPRRLRPPTREWSRITIGLIIPVRVIHIFSGILEIVIGVLVHRGNGNRAYGLSGSFIFGLLTYRGYCNRGFGLSGNLLSGFRFIGDLVIGLLTYRVLLSGQWSSGFWLSALCRAPVGTTLSVICYNYNII